MADTSGKSLRTLGRLAERQVEEKQKEIGEINKVIRQMEVRRATLTKTIILEGKLATENSDPMLYQAAGAFTGRAEHEIQDIDEATIDAEKILEERRAELKVLFAEQKRYETLEKRRLEAEKKKRDKKEQIMLDEMGSTRHQNGDS